MYKGLREGRALFYIRLEINPAGNVDKDTSHGSWIFRVFFAGLLNEAQNSSTVGHRRGSDERIISSNNASHLERLQRSLNDVRGSATNCPLVRI